MSVNTATVDVDVDAADDFGTGNLVANPGGGATLGQARVTERKSGMTTSIGIRGFIGAEYFVLPMISVGGEFGWGLGFTSNGSGSETSEGEGLDGGGANQIATISTTTDKSGSFGFDTDNVNSVFGPAGSLRMTFHF